MHNLSSSLSLIISIFSLVGLPSAFPIFITPGHGQSVDTLSLEGWSIPQHIPLELKEDEASGAFHAAVHEGITYLVFNTTIGLNPKDIYFTFRENGTWTLPRKLSKSNVPATNPRFVIDTASVTNSPVLHVIWGEAMGNSPLPRPGGGPITDIFYTTHEEKTWSEPTSLFYTSLPGLQLPEHLTIDNTGILHLGFVARDAQTRKPTIFHMRRNGGKWSAPQSIPDARYIDFVALEEEKLLVAYLRADHAWARKMKTKDVNSIFVQQSLDGGLTWNEAVLVHRSGTKPAFAPRFLKGHAETLHLFWRKSNDQTTLSNTVLHSYSKDGLSWSQPTHITGD